MSSKLRSATTVQMLHTIVFCFQGIAPYESKRKMVNCEKAAKTMVRASMKTARRTCFINSHLERDNVVVANGGVVG